MPMYVYRCECGNEKEIFSHHVKDIKIKCNRCGKRMKRVISKGVFQFKDWEGTAANTGRIQ